MENFDIIIIGSGPGGYVAAIRASQLGFKVAIVEKEKLGGVCLNWGCIPTKALLRSSEINHLLHNLDEYGFSAKDIKFDINKIIERSRTVASKLSSGITKLMKKNKVTVIEGVATIGKNNVVNVSKEGKITDFSSKHIIIATGARARSLPGLEADGKLIWTYREAMTPDKLPKSLLIIGSGAIGIEFASFYSNLGVKVEVIEMQDNILPVEDLEISKFAHKAFTAQGIKIRVKTVATNFKKNKQDVTVTLLSNNVAEEVTYDRVIVAAGIVGNVEDIGLENTKVKVERNHIVTNQYMQTDDPQIYAIGDVCGAPWLAHKASHEAMIAVEKIAGLEVHPLNVTNIPGCTYSRPQIASVGLTEQKAIDNGYKIKVGRFPFMGNGKAIAIGETEGLIKVIFDTKTGELLGAHMIGAEVTEMIQGYVIAKNMEGTETDLTHTIFPHPSLSEMMHEAVLDAEGRVIHM